jgi:hypothetical protein
VPTSRATRVTEEFAFKRAAFHLQRHRLEQVPLGDRRNGARDLRRRPDKVVDKRIDGLFHLAPRAAREAKTDAGLGLAFVADHDTDMFELLGNPLVCRNDIVEGFRHPADETAVMGRQAHREVPAPHRLERVQKLREIERTSIQFRAVQPLSFRA